MGQEAKYTAKFGRQVSKGKAFLETDELIFRGDFRLSIPFKEMKSVVAKKGQLKISFPQGVAVFNLGLRAEKWAFKIRHPKSLLDKLDIKQGSRVAVLGIKDESFRKQLKERVSDIARQKPGLDSDAILLAANRKEDLKKLGPLQAFIKRDGSIWVVAPKGQQEIKEADVLSGGRQAGLVDVKVVAFSETHSAHKFVVPVARR